MHPDRPKLADSLAEELRRGIASHRWREWMPQQRILAAELKVSRETLRQALARLQKEGWLEAVPRKGTRIAPGHKARGSGKARQDRVINLLLPGAAGEIRPTVISWVDELRALIAAKGWHLRPVEAKACYTTSPERALKELFARTTGDGWLVRLSTLPMQRWLAQRPEPVVIAGTCHDGIALPFVDVDHRAVCRHATGTLLAAGHRHLMLLVDADGKAGDLESERGFLEATQVKSGPEVTALIARHDGRVKGLLDQVSRALHRTPTPTAIVVTQATFCLTLWSYLGSRGLRIPADISVVAQVGASYLSYLVPEPACYRVNQRVYAQTVLRSLVETLDGEKGRQEKLILPDFVRGGSLSRLNLA